VRKHIKKGRSLVKELSRERRKEAAHERVTGCEK
jgi:hypothetical protein